MPNRDTGKLFTRFCCLLSPVYIFVDLFIRYSHKMDESYLTNLPSEIIFEILARLPIRTIIHCKCVCKALFRLLQTDEFIYYHLYRSVPGLIVYRYDIRQFIKVFEFVDELGLDHHELHYNPVTEFDAEAFIRPRDGSIGVEGSVNGLLLLRAINSECNTLYICNPITREYIDLPRNVCRSSYFSIVTYGFGVTKSSSEYKVVRIFYDCMRKPGTNSLLSITKSGCQVYTVGTGSWRSVMSDSSHEYDSQSSGVYLNGNLHWLVGDLNATVSVSCFNLETERFSTFPPPPHVQGQGTCIGSLTVLGGCLCICDNTSANEIVIWIMKEYGEEKSWTKEFVISKVPDVAGECYEVVCPLKVFRDGDILMSWDDLYLFYFSNRTISTPKLELFEMCHVYSIQTRLHVPSFISLKRFAIENVRSF